MPQKKVPKRKLKKSTLPSKAFELKDETNYFKMSPVFKFYSADSNKWTLHEWNSNELKDLIKTFKQMEQIPWNNILQHGGFRIKAIKDINPPPHISPDETIYEIRVCKVKRIFGFIDKNIFNLVWFDRDHSVCPEGKNKKRG